MRNITTILLTLLLTCAVSRVHALPILIVDGPDEDAPLVFGDEGLAVSFELDSNQIGVSMDASLICSACTGSFTLMSAALGGATPADIFFVSNVTAADFGVGQPTTIFSGLDLSAGVYHLILAINSGFAVWTGTQTPTITALGATNLGSWITSDTNLGFLADSPFTSLGATDLLYSLSTASAEENGPPTADVGGDQAIRVGETVFLDGIASFDDNTTSIDLLYAWSFFSKPGGSSATLLGDNIATPTFVADVAGTYVVELTVTDEGGLSSDPDIATISSDNSAPTANAGTDQLVLVGSFVDLEGTLSSDPEDDLLEFSWVITTAPGGSVAVLNGPSSEFPRFTADLVGGYTISLVVADFIGPGLPDTVQITSASPEDYATVSIMNADDDLISLGNGEVTNQGNQNTLGNFLTQAVVALQAGDIAEAISKLNQAISRTDGCALRGSVDGNGSGRDWVTTCDAQEPIYASLTEVLSAINQ